MQDASPALPGGTRATRGPYLLAGLLCVLGGAALLVEGPVARWFLADYLPGDVQTVIELAETFAHGAGIAVILIAVATLDPARRWVLPRIIAIVATAGLAANLGKLFLERTRPEHFDLSLPTIDSFGQWLPLLSVGDEGRSVPSGHTTAAFALAVGLAWAYPRGKYLFFALAILAATQRLDSGSHYLSDVLWGSSLALVLSYGILHGWLSNPWLDRLERYLYRRTARGSDPALPADSPASPPISRWIGHDDQDPSVLEAPEEETDPRKLVAAEPEIR